MEQSRGERLVVVGAPGSGKTTLARRVAATLALPPLELDALYWSANWTPTSRECFRQQVAAELAGERWVVDGNYSMVRDLVWGRADTLLWLDYPFAVSFLQLLRRTFRRVVKGEVLWNGNRETVANAFFSRDSILLWAWKEHRKTQRTMPALVAQQDYAHLTVIRLGSPRDTDLWLASLGASNSGG